MPKTVAALVLAVLVAGMTGTAPFVGGRCDAGVSAMPGMGTPSMGMGGPHADAERAAGSAGGADHGPAPAPAPPPGHHGCCCCLGPCASCVVVGPPASSVVAFPMAVRVWALASAAMPGTGDAARRLLPFANGPPSLLG